MSEPKDESKAQEKKFVRPKGYFIVNPAGAVHTVTRELAREALAKSGYRMATDAEGEQLVKVGYNQRADQTIAPRWSPEPPAEPEI